MSERYPKSYDPKPGMTCFNSIPLFLLFFILAGFSKDRAVDVYQARYAKNFQCPYDRDGSCSETFRKDGAKALMQKCRDARKQ